MDRAYRASTRLFGAVTFLIGLGLIGVTLAQGGGPLAIGVVVGAAFAALGALRYGSATNKND